MIYSCFFFFQAEDGIRDVAVTGVQTCALPIYVPSAMLLGIQRDPGPPVVFGPHRFERLRIVIVDRDPAADDDGGGFDAEESDDTEILPQLALQRRGPLPPARPVHGEILRGEDGALYER